MVKLYEVGLNYKGEISESDFIVFENEKKAEKFIKSAAIRVMITLVSEKKLTKLSQICQKNFEKSYEDVTNPDVDKLDEKSMNLIFKELKVLQEENGVEDYFIELVDKFTDIDDKEYLISLKSVK